METKWFLYENIVDRAMLKEYKEEDKKGPYKWKVYQVISANQAKKAQFILWSLYDVENDKIFGFRHNEEEIIFDHDHSDDYEIIKTPGNSTWLLEWMLEKHYKNGIIKVFKKRINMR